jgi:hypothetical protein
LVVLILFLNVIWLLKYLGLVEHIYGSLIGRNVNIIKPFLGVIVLGEVTALSLGDKSIT